MSNYSKQREEILEVIKSTKTHPTAEEIYNMVTKIDAKISKSTVYRNINILVEENVIEKVVMPVGPDRFDYIHEQHHHAVCTICGKVYDFVYNFNTDEIAETIKKQSGIETNANIITINGICNNCKSKIKI